MLRLKCSLKVRKHTKNAFNDNNDSDNGDGNNNSDKVTTTIIIIMKKNQEQLSPFQKAAHDNLIQSTKAHFLT